VAVVVAVLEAIEEITGSEAGMHVTASPIPRPAVSP